MKIVTYITFYYLNACRIFMSMSLLNSGSNNFYFHCFLNSLAKRLTATSIFVLERPACLNKMSWTFTLSHMITHGLVTTEMSFFQFWRKIQAPADIVAGSWFRWLSFQGTAKSLSLICSSFSSILREMPHHRFPI